MTYLLLVVAIAFEVIAKSALKATEGFTRLGPSIVTIFGYSLAFHFLSLTLKTMPVGIVYAVWSGAGVVLIAAIGWVYYRQSIDLPGLIGIALILAGVLVVNLFSKSIGH
jgi:small multidrug resistance pump